jgi:hypothetical protein
MGIWKPAFRVSGLRHSMGGDKWLELGGGGRRVGDYRIGGGVRG